MFFPFKNKSLFFTLLVLTAILLFCDCSLIKNGRQGAQTSEDNASFAVKIRGLFFTLKVIDRDS